MIICQDVKPDLVIDKNYLKECRRKYVYYYNNKKYKSIMTQNELATKLSKTKRQIRRYETYDTKKTLPPPDVIKKLVLILNLDLYKLFGLKQYEINEGVNTDKHTVEVK